MEHFLKIFSLFILLMAAEVLAIVANGGWQDFTTAVNGWSGIGALLGSLAIVAIVIGLWIIHGAVNYEDNGLLLIFASVAGALVVVALVGLGIWLKLWQHIGVIYTAMWIPLLVAVGGAFVIYFARLSRTT